MAHRSKFVGYFGNTLVVYEPNKMGLPLKVESCWIEKPVRNEGGLRLIEAWLCNVVLERKQGLGGYGHLDIRLKYGPAHERQSIDILRESYFDRSRVGMRPSLLILLLDLPNLGEHWY